MTEGDLTEIEKYLNQYGKDMVEAMKQVLRDKGKSDTNIFNYLNYEVFDGEGGKYSHEIEFFFPDYVKWVDEGRGPYVKKPDAQSSQVYKDWFKDYSSGKEKSIRKQPPIKEIKKWMVRKGIPEQYAFPIARKIGKFGIPPTNFLSPLRESRNDFIKGLEIAAAQDTANAVVKAFKANDAKKKK
jgi:hypothetical protein